MVLYNDTVVLTEGNFTFTPSNASVSYEISNFTDMGALYATGLDFKVTDPGKMAGEMNGNMTEKTFVLESIEGYQNNNETQEKWFILINGVLATENIGMNPVNASDTVSFVYAPEEAGRPVLEGEKYLVEIGISTETQMPDIIETATQAGNFTTLLAALNATNLTDTFKGEGPFTVFAPTDEAFAALPNGTVEGLFNDTEALKNILLYHVAGEKLTAEDVANMTNITTLQGSELPVNVTEEGVFVGDARIVMQDVETSNGVIHIIDAVLIPPAGPSERKDIIETATSKGFKTFRAALNATNLTDTLKGEGPFTVFAPTDKAFAALPNGTLKALLNDTEALKNILLYHVAGEKLTAEDVANMTNITTLQGSELPVNVTEEGVFVGDAKIILQDLNASNGVLHAIDAVLIPPEPAPEQNLTVLYNVLYNDTVSLNEGNVKFRENITRKYTVDNFTDFGALYATGLDFNASLMQNMTGNMTNMTNVSFFLGSIEGIRNNNTTGEKWFVYINGVPAEENFGMNNVNYGDKLSFWYTTEEDGKAAIENATYVANITVADLMARANIIQEAQNQTSLTTFVNATETANLTQTLNETGPYTVCIPSNEAFDKLPATTRNELMNNTTLLREVLSYHVISGRFTREQLIGMKNVTNIQGNVLQINTIGNSITIQNVNITQIIIVNNGVICIIDRVLIPPDSGLPFDGNQTDGNQIDGNQTDGNQIDGNQTDGNQTDGNQTDGNQTDGNQTDGNQTDGNQTDGNQIDGNQIDGNQIDGNQTDGNQTDGNQTDGNQTDGNQTDGNQTDGNQTDGNQTDGNQTDGNQTDGNQTDGNQIDGNQTDGNQTDGNQTVEDKTGDWHFFSIPFEANNTSVDYLLSDVNYTSLIYYNVSTKLYEDVSDIEPLKGYWINVPNGTEFNSSEQFASVEKKQVTVPPSLQVYPGWNALGSPVNETVPAEAAFISLNDSYAKIMGPWVPGSNTTGYYQYVGYNGINGTIAENQLGADEFKVEPYQGYWVFMRQENLYA
ncbi:hypothetical protein MSLAZ_1409 [Methanosarcina lacustris Z-7289]|uniref:FAS1 domain-containing protein n=1 Tax=Methanosarcina lacustris Z-7289 TaxID=1434111 RepID=A0A0E3WRM0_9EURY|nr:fasciclin domain-containing protein [Methanosarcina lacustris]AKB74670.1 hypothetical protein MSLAZ_1409 [Methanosarcina lacustris Z-7289]